MFWDKNTIQYNDQQPSKYAVKKYQWIGRARERMASAWEAFWGTGPEKETRFQRPYVEDN